MKKIAFTIVLNGMPFIKEQYKYVPTCFDKWYIIEGHIPPINLVYQENILININVRRWNPLSLNEIQNYRYKKSSLNGNWKCVIIYG